MDPVIIVGTGLAGYNLAKEIRKHSQDVPLMMITADAGESYSKPMLSNALAKGKSAQQLVLKSSEDMSAQLNATISTATTVNAIDVNQRILKTSSGELTYSKLVLAMGASQIKPPIGGDAADKIVTVNSLADYRMFREQLENAHHVAVIGAGLIGCEFANDLLSVGKKVTVIGSSETPLDRLLIAEIGELLKNALQKNGVNWKLGARVLEVNTTGGDSDGYRLKHSDATEIDVDLVLSATGLAPNIDIAKQAGLTVNKGIVVNQYLQTTSADVFALGDCVEINELVMAYVLPLMNGARALAKTLTGEPTAVKYPPMPVVVKTPAYPIVVAPPAPGVDGGWKVEIDGDGAKATYLKPDNSLAGFVLTDKKIREKLALTKLLPDVM